MAKRFTDSRKYNDPWFRKLTPIHKCFWDYIITTCDHAGVWKVDFEMAEFCIGTSLERDIPKEFKGRIERISEEKWFIPKFIFFQYGTLQENNRVHQSVISILKKEGAYKGLRSTLKGCKNKDKNKDKDKDIIITDQEFLKNLKINPLYKHINIDHEFKKMEEWLRKHPERRKTRRFITNWLNKIEKPITEGKKYYVR